MIDIQVAPHIKKFIDKRLGSPIILDDSCTFFLLLRIVLFSRQSGFPDLNFIHADKKVIPGSILIKFPHENETALTNTSLSRCKLRLSALFTRLFEEELHQYICSQDIQPKSWHKSIKKHLNLFCEMYGIEVEEDISQDALIKGYYRYRNDLKQKPVATICPFLPPVQESNLYRAAVC